jgi:SAM-dependent methyltransferase
MKECSKSIRRRLADPNFGHRYFVGHGIDIGGKPDPLALYAELFTRIASQRTRDLEDGDAQFLAGVPDGSHDYVHRSHCLEHLRDPQEGLANWFRVLRPGGHLVVTLPDEDLYEQGVFPSTFNRDHKHTFTIFKRSSWSSHSINVLTLLQTLGAEAQILKIELLDAGFRYALPRYDQTLTPIGESGIEIVVRKRQPAEVARGGRLPGTAQPDRQSRIHLNQYRDDAARMKAGNVDHPPFGNDADV